MVCGVVSVGCFAIASDGVWWRGLLGAVIGLSCCGVLGGLVVIKRSVLGALASGMLRLTLGKRTLDLLLAGVFDVSDQAVMGERGVQVARAVERLPLDQAEARLRQAGQRLLGASDGWFRRKLHARLLDLVQTVTLARFRDDAAAHGGVDLVEVRDQLGHTLDELLFRQLEGLATRLTISLAMLAIGVSGLAALLLRFLA